MARSSIVTDLKRQLLAIGRNARSAIRSRLANFQVGPAAIAIDERERDSHSPLVSPRGI